MLTRAAIFAAEDLKSEIVGVPEWGGAVKVQEMSGALRIRWENAVAGLGADAGLKILGALVVCSVVDESGEPLFTDADIDALGKKTAAALTLVYNAATKVSGLRPADLDNAVKN